MTDAVLTLGVLAYAVGVVPAVAPRLRSTVLRALLWCPALLCLVIPFCAPSSGAAFFSTVSVLPVFFRMADVAFHRVPDDSFVYRRGWLWRVLFFVLPDLHTQPATKLPQTTTTMATILAALSAFAPVLPMYVLHGVFGRVIEAHELLSVPYWSLFVVLQVPASYGVLLVVLRRVVPADVAVSPAFVSPLRAPNVAAFWSAHWNLVFVNFAHRHIFAPLSALGLNHAVCAAAVFAVSGLIHEWVVACSLGWSRCGGFFLFFVLQYVACWWYRRRRSSSSSPVRKSSPVSSALTIGWLLLSGWPALATLRDILRPLSAQMVPLAFA
jgi:hypothetical protein